VQKILGVVGGRAAGGAGLLCGMWSRVVSLKPRRGPGPRAPAAAVVSVVGPEQRMDSREADLAKQGGVAWGQDRGQGAGAADNIRVGDP